MELHLMQPVRDSTANLQLLSTLLLSAPFSTQAATEATAVPRSMEAYFTTIGELAAGLDRKDFEDLKALAITNHVILRSFAPLQQVLEARGNPYSAEWIATAVQRETERINHALGFLAQICTALDEGGCPVTVIKSLDHWPDLGSDLDLYTDANPAKVVDLMRTHFKAELADRSW